MIKTFLTLSALSLSIISWCVTSAQKIPDPRPFAATITTADLTKNLYIIAGKDFEGRETATPGQHKAGSFIEDQFRSLGLRPGAGKGYQLYYPVYQDSLIGASIQVDGQTFNPNEDFSVVLSLNHTETLYAGEVVFAGYGFSDSLRDDYKGLDVKGKVVIILMGAPPQAVVAPPRSGSGSRRRNPFGPRLEAAQRHGVAALLMIQGGFPRRNVGDKGMMYQDAYSKTISPNVFVISEKIAGAIMGADYAAAKGGTDPLFPVYKTKIMLALNKNILTLQSSDVLGFLEGTDLKNEFVIVSAHYDHLGKKDSVIYYGADDDGSGTVSVLAMAKAFAKAKAAGKGPRRSILFLANSGEEEGLWGSDYYTEHPIYPLDSTAVDLNIDMIGRIDPNRKQPDSTNYVYVIGDDKLSSDLKPISEMVNTKYNRLDLDYKFNDPKDPERIYYRSDHYNFARKGVPIIFYFDGLHHDYHKPTDTPDKIDYALLEKRAKLVFYTAWEMANRKTMLKRDLPLPE